MFFFFALSSVFLLFLLHKLPCKLQNVIKLHKKLRNDEMSLVADAVGVGF
jgi:hypothetical protein